MSNHRANSQSPIVFISYRNCDQPWAATVLDRELSRHLGDDAVFIDSKSVRPGTPFDNSLLAGVRNSAVILVVIGDRWFAESNNGRRFLDHRNDWVRREITTAFAARKTVVPVLVGDVPRLEGDRLPVCIRQLARCQAVRLRHRDSRRDLAHLVKALSELFRNPELS